MDQKNRASEFDKVIGNVTLLQMKEAVKANESLGVKNEFNRKTFDDVTKRKEFKNEVFGDKKTIKDPLTGETIHKSHAAAKNKYKHQSTSKKWAKHASETDHIVSLKRGHARLKKNPFLTDQDVQSLLNDKKYNFREAPKSFNTSKGERSDFDLVNTVPLEGKLEVVKSNIKAETGIFAKGTLLTTKNVGKEFTSGAVNALEASAIPVMIEGVHNLYLVASGEKKFEDAAKDMGKLTAQIAVSGGGLQVATTGLTNVLKNSSSEVLKKVAGSNQIGQVISVALILTESVGRYVNGEIDGEEFFREVGEKGVGLVSGMAGAVIGQALIPIPYVGAFIGSMIVSTVCMGIYRSYMSLNDHKDKLDKVSSLASQALAEMERQREVLKEMTGEQFSQWDQQFNQGFEEIFNATLNNDVDGISNGLDRILGVFGKSVKFKTFDEFDEFFMDENATFTF